MLTGSASFVAKVGSVDQVVACQFTLDLPVLGDVDLTNATAAVSIDGQMSSTTPDAVRQQAGLSTVGGTVTVGGLYDPTDESKSMWWLLNPDNPDSPLYRTDIRGSACQFMFGFGGGDLLPLITGTITSFRVAHDARSVELDVTEQADGWGQLPAVPAAAIASPFNAGLTSEYVMDAIIRSQQGVSSWPAQRPHCVLAVGFRSSLWAEVGSLDIASDQPQPEFSSGPYGSGLSGAVVGASTWGAPMYTLDTGTALNAVRIEFLFTVAGTGSSITVSGWSPGFAGAIARDASLTVRSSSGTWQVTLSDISGNTATWNLASLTLNTPHRLVVDIAPPSGGGISGTFYLDGLSHAFSVAIWDSFAVPSQWTNADSETTGAAVIAGLMITAENAAGWNDFTPAAVLDPSPNPLSVCPPIAADTAAWDELQTIAAAEQGYIRRDANGIIRFSNRNTLAAAPISLTIDSTTALKTLDTDVPAKVTYDRVQVPYSLWDTDNPAGLVWQATAKIKIPAGQTVTITRKLADGQVAALLDTTISPLPDGHDPTDGGSWYRASRDRNGIDEHGNLTAATAVLPNSNTIQMTFNNTGGFDAWLVTSSAHADLDVGTPALWIGGILATSTDDLSADVSTGDGTSLLTLDSNAYRQDGQAAVDLGEFVLNQTSVSIRNFTNVAIVPDARIEIGDKDRIIWPDAAIDEYVQVWGRSFTASFPPAGQSGGDWSMTLAVSPLGPPGSWLLGIAGRSEVGATTWLP